MYCGQTSTADFPAFTEGRSAKRALTAVVSVDRQKRISAVGPPSRECQASIGVFGAV